GAWPQAGIEGKPEPYPIFLGYGVSRDGGKNWDFDLSRPAFAPRLEYDEEKFAAESMRNGRVFDYANGCIEDPRLFYFEGGLYLTVACRAFPPGPYWDYDDPEQCLPDWVIDHGGKYGAGVKENRTVTMLYKVDLQALKSRCYEKAFSVVTPLHQPEISDDRDVMLFPRRLKIDGKEKIICIHRPKTPWNYDIGKDLKAPSIFFAVGDSLTDFYEGKAESFVFAVPEFPWEANRIGCSWAPLEIAPGKWLFPYHGKQDDAVGYTQSFMILQEREKGLPEIIVRPSGRMLYADEAWELEGEFTIPCLFSCSGVLMPDGKLLMAYGAADKKAGIAEVDYRELLEYLGQS
ncbi:MAG: hypothetical protein IKC08_09435, partial [Lentisphaeria bacterium]|nr:hypothetical protein [Lentisphaeria bacterium]